MSFTEGESPETILQSFPTLTLAQVYGAIAYYLETRSQSTTTLPECSVSSNDPCRR